MSIFTPTIYSEPSFTGLFRLLDDFDTYRAGTAASPSGNTQQQQQQQQLTGSNNVGTVQRNLLGGSRWPAAFNPKFDLRETDAAFELHGDLPGVEKDQVHIEFTDENTLTVRGRVEREWKSSSDNETADTAAKSGEATTGTAKGEANGGEASKDKDTSNETKDKQVTSQSTEQPKARYWITERSVGEFSRSFRLGGHHGADGSAVEIDHDGVKAKLEHGVLSVTVPKKVKKESKERRRIAIN